MELVLLLFLLPTLCLIILFKLVTRTGSKAKEEKARLPPGPWELPVIGSMHHLIIGSSLPHHTFRDLARKHGPLMHMKLGHVSTIIISSPQVAREFMTTHDINFSSRPKIIANRILSYDHQDMLFASYGEFWRQLRRICIQELLSSRKVQSLQSIRREEVLNLINTIKRNISSVVNLSEMLYSLGNDITVRAVIGTKCKDQADFLQVLDEAIEASSGFNLADLYPSSRLVNLFSLTRLKLEQCFKKTDRIFQGILQEHRERRMARKQSGAITLMNNNREEGEDFVDVLLRIQEEGTLPFPLTNECIKSVIFDMFSAGSETSANTLEWAMTELMRNPTVMRKAQREVREVLTARKDDKLNEEEAMRDLYYLKMVIKETLRLHPPAPLLLPRECQETCEVLGYKIPAKARVLVNVWAMGRDPKYWDDAEEFKPERFDGNPIDFKGANFEYLPFGAGRRMCPGVHFGLAVVELVLAQLLFHFDWKLPPDGVEPSCLDMTETFGATAKRKADLFLCAASTPYG
ncbi:hypothetical protein J5N97_008382 [Dioscorea zingiberensis]|uniref:Cytochrome P450 n=1 Tax=Dioscorea zingiberensis TaxID=325984 RepID=A0A9D5CWU7_9LILI|nr:hypothetical protein J5N97_008382 [Dioscorea zingiberensis]